MYRTSKKLLAKRTGLSAIIAVGALVSGVGVAGAATHAPTTHSLVATSHSHGEHHAPGAMGGPGGRIIALSATSITVQNPSGVSHSYAIDASTVVTLDGRPVTIAIVALGDNVRIETSGANAVTASSIDIVLAHLGGRVESVSADTITISDRNGFYRSIRVTSTTAYVKGSERASFNDVSVGSFIVAAGTVDANHTTLGASLILIGRPQPIAGALVGPMGSNPSARGVGPRPPAGA